MNIVLMGLRGSGKSTLGARLAGPLRRTFVDLDHLTPTALHAPDVSTAWKLHGEPAFRRAETTELRRALATRDDLILALGGGTPTAPGAVAILNEHQTAGTARLIYLKGSAATLRDRLSRSDNLHRPSLTGADTLDEIDAVLAARDPLYTSLADLVITIDGRDLDATATELDAAIRAISRC